MSVCTQLFIHSKYSDTDIASLVNFVSGSKGKWQSTHLPTYATYSFKLDGENRNLNVFFNHELPTGMATMLDLGQDNSSQKFLRTIAERIGGIFIPSDCRDNAEIIVGLTSESNGLPYFVKYGIVNGLTDGQNIPELKKIIKDWGHSVRSKANIVME